MSMRTREIKDSSCLWTTRICVTDTSLATMDKHAVLADNLTAGLPAVPIKSGIESNGTPSSMNSDSIGASL